jgi:hypothetical protein
MGQGLLYLVRVERAAIGDIAERLFLDLLGVYMMMPCGSSPIG